MTHWNDFDYELMDALETLPPSAETVEAVTPWHEAMSRITWGLILLTFQLKFLYLDYLLPAVGTVLLYLGFRGLRQANRYFHFGWIISICKAVLFYASHLFLATPLLQEPPFVLTVFGFVLTPLLYLSLWLGIRQAAKDVDHTSARQPALWALLWYGVLTLFALYWPKPGWIPVLIMAALYVCILCSLRRVTKDLTLWGYDASASPARVSAGRFAWLYLGTLLLAAALAAMLSSHIVSDFVPAEKSHPIDALTELGLPEDVAVQLLPEDLESLRSAVRYDYEKANQGHNYKLSDNETFAFMMPDGSVRAVHLFTPGDKGGFWQCHMMLRSNAHILDAQARLFYTRGGQRFTSSVNFGDSTMVSGKDSFFDMYFEQSTATAQPFSWPLRAKERSAYVIFTVDQEANPKTVFDELLSYTAQKAPAYPFHQEHISYEWSAGSHVYYGNGSGLMYKADEMD